MKREIHPIITRLFKRATLASWCLVLMLSLIWQHSHSAFAQTKPQVLPPSAPKRIVLLYSYGDGIPAYQQATRAFLSVMKEGGVSFNHLFFEYLDLERNKDKEHKKNLVTLLRHKYANEKIELVVTVHTPALRFLLNEGRSLFPKTRVLCYLAPDMIETAGMEQQFVLLPMRMDFRGTLELAQRLFPQTKRVVLISGVGEGDKRLESEAKSAFEQWRDKLEFEYTSQLSLEEMLQRIATLPPRAIVIYSNLFTDKTGRTFVARDVAEMIAKVANAPVFGTYNTILGSGIIGGSVFNFEEEGARAGKVALEILRGKLSLTEPVTVLTASRTPMFDWLQLKRWGLIESALPPGSIVLNRPVSGWKEHKLEIIGILAFCLVETALIIFLIVQKRRRDVAEKTLKLKTEELDRFFNVSLDLLCVANTDGYFLRLNPAWEKVLGYTREELTAKQFLEFVHPDDLDSTREAIATLASQQQVTLFENRYRCKDGTYRWLQWSATPAGNLIYAAARDVTEQKLAEQAIEERLRFEQLLSDLSARFVNIPSDQVDSEIERGLKQILEFLHVDRCGLLQASKGKTTWQVTHAAYADGIAPVPLKTDLSSALFPWVYKKIVECQEVVTFARLGELPAEADVDKQTYIEWGIRSSVNVPVITGGSGDYIVSINSVKRERVWPEEFIPRLRLLGQIFVNVMERREMQREIQSAAEGWQKTFDSVKDLVMILDGEFKLVRVNAATLSLFNLPLERVVGNYCYTLMHGTSKPVEFCPITKMIETKRHEEVELYDETRKAWFHVSVDPIVDSKGEITRVVHTVKDVTERKRAEDGLRESERELRQSEADLRRLAGRLISAQEEERSRLARELHDDLAQRLAVFAIDVGKLETQLMDPPTPVQEKLREMKEDVVRISQDVHSLSRQLHPSILDDLGLIKAVESECKNFSRREGADVVFNHENISTIIPKDVSLSLYRIIQEGLTNISKHACADHISVSLKGIDHDVFLSVQDDGIGFDSTEVKEKPGLGLSSIRERVRLIHGELSIQSQPEKGTLITVRVPLIREGE